MERTPVTSSNIAEVGYDMNTMTLEILFTSGGIYRYNAVPLSIYEGFMATDSKGKYFHAHIKSRFEFIKVEQHRPQEHGEVMRAIGHSQSSAEFGGQEHSVVMDAVLGRA